MNKAVKMSGAGKRQPLVDGIEKVTGKAIFTADMETDDCLVGRILRSPVSHGKIVSIDVSKAKNELNWTAKTELEIGLKKTIEFYK